MAVAVALPRLVLSTAHRLRVPRFAERLVAFDPESFSTINAHIDIIGLPKDQARTVIVDRPGRDVSLDFLYRQPELRARIEELRKAERQPEPTATPSRSTVVHALTQQLREVRAENGDLRRRLEVAHGEIVRRKRPGGGRNPSVDLGDSLPGPGSFDFTGTPRSFHAVDLERIRRSIALLAPLQPSGLDREAAMALLEELQRQISAGP